MAGFYKAGKGAPLRTKEDQELWDKVAAEAVGGLAAKQWNDYAVMVEHAAGIADLFMAERAKRMELVIREGQK